MEYRKQEINNLLNSNYDKKFETKNKNKIKSFCEKEQISKFHFNKKEENLHSSRKNSSSQFYFTKGIKNKKIIFKFLLKNKDNSNDIITKMKKKFPEFIQNERMGIHKNRNTTVESNNKLNSIKYQIEKLFDERLK